MRICQFCEHRRNESHSLLSDFSVQEISVKFQCAFISFVNIGGMKAILYLVTFRYRRFQ